MGDIPPPSDESFISTRFLYLYQTTAAFIEEPRCQVIPARVVSSTRAGSRSSRLRIRVIGPSGDAILSRSARPPTSQAEPPQTMKAGHARKINK